MRISQNYPARSNYVLSPRATNNCAAVESSGYLAIAMLIVANGDTINSGAYTTGSIKGCSHPGVSTVYYEAPLQLILALIVVMDCSNYLLYSAT